MSGAPAPLPAGVSDRLRRLTALAVVLVCLIHGTTARSCGGPGGAGGGPSAADRAEGFVVYGLARVAVPYFFFASGLLLCSGVRAAGWAGKLGRRARGVAAPYLVWSGLWLAAYAAALNSPAAGLARQLDGPAGGGAGAWLRAWLLDPVAGQLWFLRDLLVLTAAAPAWAGLPRAARAAAVVGLLGVWVASPERVVIADRPAWWVVSPVGLFWFAAGAEAGLRGWVPPALPRPAAAAAAAAWVAAAAVGSRAVPVGWPVGWADGRQLADRASVVAGLAALWAAAAGRDGRPLGRPAAALARHAFLLYAAHFPPVAAAVVVLSRWFGCGFAGRAATFLAATAGTLAAATAAAELLRRYLPRLHTLLSGGRGRRDGSRGEGGGGPGGGGP